MTHEKTNKTHFEIAKKRAHDIHASLRFLEHLYNEIKIAESIEDINDPCILNKFKSTLSFLKKELKKI
ncbi:hypothetical protein [Fluviispira sanaruensis]|uniref:Uncharacterized protein n=1 Tax=Fluviispira sanaruensis TaxID=2493639 RepID=A0A4P2VJI2_FLUSA|nr:hypothetical protein [Fluviispira sanaruensis]BBH53373.1 hypothetical protein JCM31447_18160 [Fluviispira sanaruensis]